MILKKQRLLCHSLLRCLNSFSNFFSYFSSIIICGLQAKCHSAGKGWLRGGGIGGGGHRALTINKGWPPCNSINFRLKAGPGDNIIEQEVLVTMGKHIKTLAKPSWQKTINGRGCRECQTSCQSACKTSITVSHQSCLKESK